MGPTVARPFPSPVRSQGEKDVALPLLKAPDQDSGVSSQPCSMVLFTYIMEVAEISVPTCQVLRGLCPAELAISAGGEGGRREEK